MSQKSGKKQSATPPEQSPESGFATTASSSPAPAASNEAEKERAKTRVHSTHPLGHASQRAERIAQLNQISPDMPQLVVAAAGALLVGVLYQALPSRFILGPRWLLPAVEIVLLAPPFLAVVFLGRHLAYRVARGLALALSTVLTAALIASVLLWIVAIIHPNLNLTGAALLRSGAVLWACNVLVFAVWYWEYDGNGPRARKLAKHLAKDFRFPQQEEGNPTGWAPGFVDYLFLAFCSATALSPADTMPLTQRAKLMTMAEAILSMAIIVLLVARSVNIL
jgi:uncharacterized membrane protein